MKNQKTNNFFSIIAGFSILMLLFIFSACGVENEVVENSSESVVLDNSSSIVIEEPVDSSEIVEEIAEPINEDDVEKVFRSSPDAEKLAFSFGYMGSFVADDLGLWTKQGYEDRLNPAEGCTDCHIPFMEIKQLQSEKTLEEYISGDTELMQVGANLYTRFEDAGTVTYYLKEGGTILSFKVFSLDDENDDFMNAIASLSFE